MLLFHVCIAECSTPKFPLHSVVTQILRETGCGNPIGTSVMFQCEEGLYPDAPITITCIARSDSSVRWVPDPTLVKCTTDSDTRG